MARSILYVGDQDPTLTATVTDSSGNIINLTGYTGVQFAFRQAYDTANKFKAAGTIVTPASGVVSYTLSNTDLASLTPGLYFAQWILTDSGGKPQHVDAGEFELRSGF